MGSDWKPIARLRAEASRSIVDIELKVYPESLIEHGGIYSSFPMPELYWTIQCPSIEEYRTPQNYLRLPPAEDVHPHYFSAIKLPIEPGIINEHIIRGCKITVRLYSLQDSGLQFLTFSEEPIRIHRYKGPELRTSYGNDDSNTALKAKPLNSDDLPGSEGNKPGLEGYPNTEAGSDTEFEDGCDSFSGASEGNETDWPAFSAVTVSA